MKKLILFVVIILSSSQLFANKNDYKSGYVILESGDTLFGFIENQAWRINPTSVKIIVPAMKNDTITYQMNAIKGFSSNDFIFVKRAVTIDQHIDKLNDIFDYEPAPYREDTVLLQVLINGEASLYIYTEASERKHYYIESKAAELQELLNIMYKVTKIDVGGTPNHFVGYSEDYKTQLLTTLVGCKSITYNDVNIEFKESYLYKLVYKYNQCMNTGSTDLYAKEIEKWQVKPYLSAGMDIASTKFKSDENAFTALENSEFSTSINFSASFGFLYVIPKQNKKLNIYTELNYTHYNFELKKPTNSSTPGTISNIKYSQVPFNFGLIYNLGKSKQSAYLRTGVSTIFSFGYNFEGYSASMWQYPRKFQFGFNLGAGINFSNLAIEYQFLIASGFSPYNDVKNVPITNYILLKYTFGK
jgi:hypothetical protein